MRRVLISLLAGVALAGCRDVRSTSPTPFAGTLLALASDAHESSPEEEAWADAELDRIAARVRLAVGAVPARERSAALITAMNAVVFGALGFVREVDKTSLRFVLLPSVLRDRRGNCVGLGTMYLALGERLSLPTEGVLRPGHFFVRMRDGAKTRNVELLRNGQDMPDSWYAMRFPLSAGGASEYGRGLSLSEVRGVVEYDVGSERRRQGRVSEARSAYERSTRDFPDFAEAHASLGAMQQLLGELDKAETSYGSARRANAALPGLDWNIGLLARERSADR